MITIIHVHNGKRGGYIGRARTLTAGGPKVRLPFWLPLASLLVESGCECNVTVKVVKCQCWDLSERHLR